MLNALTRLPGFLKTVVAQRRRVDAPPRFLTWTVTFGCNARCIMCDSWKLPTAGDLTAADAARIFDQLPRLDAVRLTGGEPFVRADFPELARLAQVKLVPLVLHITTNGFLTDRIVKFCERREKNVPLELLVSLDGVGEKHNTIRGSSLAYSSALKTLQTLAPRRKELNLRLAVNQTVVDAEGIDHYRQLREVLAPLGVRHQMVMAYDVSATYSTERGRDVAPTEMGQFATFGTFTQEHFEELLAEAEADLPRLPFLERRAKRYYLAGLRSRLLEGGGSPNPPCVALTSHLRLFPNGDVPTCQFNGQIVGNLKTESFADVWNSVAANTQRRWVRGCPGCWAECEVVPSAIYTLDLLRPLGRTPPAERVLALSGEREV